MSGNPTIAQLHSTAKRLNLSISKYVSEQDSLVALATGAGISPRNIEATKEHVAAPKSGAKAKPAANEVKDYWWEYRIRFAKPAVTFVVSTPDGFWWDVREVSGKDANELYRLLSAKTAGTKIRERARWLLGPNGEIEVTSGPAPTPKSEEKPKPMKAAGKPAKKVGRPKKSAGG